MRIRIPGPHAGYNVTQISQMTQIFFRLAAKWIGHTEITESTERDRGSSPAMRSGAAVAAC